MIAIVVALAAEARPLIRELGLKPRPLAAPAPFHVAQNESITVIRSGIGKAAAASAVGYLHGALGDRPPRAWLNVGIAGHRSLPIGTALLANKVIDRASSRCFYPQRVFDAPCERACVCTVDQVERDYDHPEQPAYEMEAAGFCAVASRLVTCELVHCLKVISDSPTNSVDGVTADGVEQLIRAKLHVVEQTIDALEQLVAELDGLTAPPPLLEELTAHVSFSATQRHALARDLRRLQTLGGMSEGFVRRLREQQVPQRALSLLRWRLRSLR